MKAIRFFNLGSGGGGSQEFWVNPAFVKAFWEEKSKYSTAITCIEVSGPNYPNGLLWVKETPREVSILLNTQIGENHEN